MGHLTKEQRYTIEVLKGKGISQKEIADTIGRSKSVVSRELNRNCDKRNGSYSYEQAHRKYESRLDDKPRRKSFTSNIRQYVNQKLVDKFSPEQIVGEAKLLGIPIVSHERIYQHVWTDKRKGGDLFTHLRTQGKRYRKRGSAKDNRGIIKDRVDISERPQVVEEKNRFGDLEIDTIIGKDHKGAIVTINDRAMGLLRMKKLSGKDAQELADKTIELLQEWKPMLHTITSDNGKEFACHAQIGKALGVDFYFAKPYHSWERGANENINGLIRQYIPKKTNFDDVTDEYVKFVEDELNNRPRKRYGYKTPNEVFNTFVDNRKVAFET